MSSLFLNKYFTLYVFFLRWFAADDHWVGKACSPKTWGGRLRAPEENERQVWLGMLDVWNISIFLLKATRAISFGWGSNFSLCHERGDQSWRGLNVWTVCAFTYADPALSILGFHLRLVRSINISCITCKTLQRDRRCKVTCQVSVNLTRIDQILTIPLRETLNCEVCGERLRIEGELPGVTYCQVEVQSLTMLYCMFVSQLENSVLTKSHNKVFTVSRGAQVCVWCRRSGWLETFSRTKRHICLEKKSSNIAGT